MQNVTLQNQANLRMSGLFGHTLIFERGVGLSPSSGTGSMAIACACRSFKGLEPEITVEMAGGAQTVFWSGGGQRVEGVTNVTLLEEGTLSPSTSRISA